MGLPEGEVAFVIGTIEPELGLALVPVEEVVRVEEEVDEAFVTGTSEPDTEGVMLTVTVWVIISVRVDCDCVTGDPSVDDVESVPFLGRLL